MFRFRENFEKEALERNIDNVDSNIHQDNSINKKGGPNIKDLKESEKPFKLNYEPIWKGNN